MAVLSGLVEVRERNRSLVISDKAKLVMRPVELHPNPGVRLVIPSQTQIRYYTVDPKMKWGV